jgi:hypothetical protein
MTIGLSGDMGSPKAAARDPIFWLHHANIDRMWVGWTDAARGRFAPVDDPVWMSTKFTFVDENGEDRSSARAPRPAQSRVAPPRRAAAAGSGRRAG